MKYQAGQRRKSLEYEKAIAEWWKKNKTFEQSVENRPIDKSYVFYDGPPFITGNPHHGTLLSSIVKDAVPRFYTMNGYRVERRWGWDCHGLPAENFVEKQLGITDRREIGTKWSLEDYIIKARESMVANSETWRATIDRVGRWVDFDNCYRTMNKDFMESVWWAFKQLYEAGKIYEGRKVLMYDTKFATPVSKAEVTMDNDAYQTVTDPSVYVKFKSTDSKNNFLAWTTTPWTLMANRALAVSADLDYGFYDVDGQTFVVATKRAEKIFPELKPTKTVKGSELAGLKYESLDGTICQVFAADFVGEEEGTGIVHIAPAYGEDDYALYLKHEDEMDFVDTLDENGYYIPEYADKLHALGVRDTDENGIQVWVANKFIAKCLEEKGIVYKIDYIQHEYPFNPRSKERIMYRAFPSWFFDIDGQKPLMLSENENINWFKLISSTVVLPKTSSRLQIGTFHATVSGPQPCQFGKATKAVLKLLVHIKSSKSFPAKPSRTTIAHGSTTSPSIWTASILPVSTKFWTVGLNLVRCLLPNSIILLKIKKNSNATTQLISS